MNPSSEQPTRVTCAFPRVLHVTISLQPGGLEKLVAEWTVRRNRTAPGSTAVCCLDSWNGGTVAKDIPVIFLDADRGRFPWDRRAVQRLRALCNGQTSEAAFDVIHSHNLAAWQYAALAVNRSGIRHAHTEHGSMPAVSGLRDRLRIHWLARRTDRIVAVSTATANTLIHDHGLPRDRLTVIHNGIDSSGEPKDRAMMRRRVRQAFELPEHALALGSIGRLAPIKGYDRLIDAFPEIMRELQQIARTDADKLYLLLIGDGPDRAVLQQAANRAGMRDRIRFAGYRDDARNLLAAMDVFILPSRGEGLSLALLEAMAAGLPVMVTDAGDHRTVIAYGEAGILLPEKTATWPRMIAAQLSERNSFATKQRVQAAADRVRNHYTMEMTLEGYERIYGERGDA